MINLNPRPFDPLLLVEGEDDKHVIRHLSERWDRTLEFAIKDYQGIENVLPSIRDHIDEPGRPAVGVVVDADTHTLNTWNQVCGQIRNSAKTISPIPATPEPDGVIIPENPDNDIPRVGIWIMPDNISTGELEGFVSQMIPEADRVWSLSQRYVNQIPYAERKFAETKTLRAQIYAWLATREDPRQMGLAIGAHDLEVNGRLAQRFLTWLVHLFR